MSAAERWAVVCGNGAQFGAVSRWALREGAREVKREPGPSGSVLRVFRATVGADDEPPPDASAPPWVAPTVVIGAVVALALLAGRHRARL